MSPRYRRESRRVWWEILRDTAELVAILGSVYLLWVALAIII